MKTWLFACALALAAALGASETEPKILFGPANGFRAAELQPAGAQIAAVGERLRIDAPPGDPEGARRGVLFPLRENERDLANYNQVELDIANRGTTPIVFTFWALSGNGWGGVSTFSTTRNPGGRETLAPGAREIFRVDLHAQVLPFHGSHGAGQSRLRARTRRKLHSLWVRYPEACFGLVGVWLRA